MRENSLVEELSKQLVLTLEGMLGQTWTVADTKEFDADALAETPDLHIWCQKISCLTRPVMHILIGPEGWKAIGKAALQTAGIEEASDADILSTYLEILSQALAGVARLVGAAIGEEVALEEGATEKVVPRDARYFRIDARDPAGAKVPIYFGLGESLSKLMQSKAEAEEPPAAAAATATAEAAPAAAAAAAGATAGATGPPPRMEMLLDVELPVSVSFGRTQLPLKDVIKLTTGSIVELNRNVGEPVDIIVNNCIIARGEVVVVEGNYGVRIHHIVSRAERIRSLD